MLELCNPFKQAQSHDSNYMTQLPLAALLVPSKQCNETTNKQQRALEQPRAIFSNNPFNYHSSCPFSLALTWLKSCHTTIIAGISYSAQTHDNDKKRRMENGMLQNIGLSVAQEKTTLIFFYPQSTQWLVVPVVTVLQQSRLQCTARSHLVKKDGYLHHMKVGANVASQLHNHNYLDSVPRNLSQRMPKGTELHLKKMVEKKKIGKGRQATPRFQ